MYNGKPYKKKRLPLSYSKTFVELEITFSRLLRISSGWAVLRNVAQVFILYVNICSHLLQV